MSSLPGLVIRRALPSDYKGVMELDNSTWHRLDYLPALYTQLLQHPDANCFVADISGKVVGFYNLQISDQCTTAVTVALRVHRDYQRRGIATTLKKTAFEFVSTQGLVIRTRLSKSLSSEHIEQKLLDPTNTERLAYRLKAVGLCSSYESTAKGLQNSTHSFSLDAAIHCFDDDKTKELLTSSVAMSTIFKRDFFTASHNWFPFRSTPANIQAMVSSHKVFCSTDTTGDICNATSYGTCLQTENGPRYTFYFLPKPRFQGLFIAHAQKHLSHFLTVAAGSVCITFSIEIPAGCFENRDLDLFVKMFGQDVQVGWNTDVLLLEETQGSP